MQNEECKDIVVYTKDRELLSFLRETTHKISPDSKVLLNLGSTYISSCRSILLIDQRYTNTILPYSSYVTIYIANENSYTNIKNTFEIGADYILFFPENRNILECLLRKYLGKLPMNCNNIYSAKGVTLSQQTSCLIYNNCRIPLTNSEFNLLKLLILQERNSNQLKETLHYKFNKKCIQVTVWRINKKSREVLGLKLIKSRYAKGYYLAI